MQLSGLFIFIFLLSIYISLKYTIFKNTSWVDFLKFRGQLTNITLPKKLKQSEFISDSKINKPTNENAQCKIEGSIKDNVVDSMGLKVDSDVLCSKCHNIYFKDDNNNCSPLEYNKSQNENISSALPGSFLTPGDPFGGTIKGSCTVGLEFPKKCVF